MLSKIRAMEQEKLTDLFSMRRGPRGCGSRLSEKEGACVENRRDYVHVNILRYYA
jgi:hypothetical protein